MRIQSLRASSVRGIPRDWPSIPIGERGLILYGPNGSGKSSVVDALEYFLTGVWTPFPEQRAGITWDRAAPHIRGGVPSVQLSLEDRGQTFLVSNDGTVNPENSTVEDWLRRAHASSFLLRRHMLLRFIECAPRERYEALEKFLNLDRFQEFEVSLTGIRDALHVTRTKYETEYLQLDSQIKLGMHVGRDDPLTEGTMLAAINGQLAQITMPALARLDEIPKLLASVKLQLKTVNLGEKTVQFTGLRAQVLAAPELVSLVPVVNSLCRSAQEFEGKALQSKKYLMAEWLESGKKLLQATEEAKCPFCQQSIDKNKLLEELDRRIETEREIITAKQKMALQSKTALAEVAKTIAAYDLIIKSGDALRFSDHLVPYQRALAELEKLKVNLESKYSPSITLIENKNFLETLNFDKEAMRNEIDKQIGSDSLAKQTIIQKTIETSCATFIENWSKYCGLIERKKALASTLVHVERIFEHAEESRKQAVQQIIQSVSRIAASFYADIHPDEEIGTPELNVREAVRASGNLDAEFLGNREPPLVHFSESHLDTLGLSYFLAIRRAEADTYSNFKFVVLDDVLHSVDSEHRARVARLLGRYFSDHQLLATTHDINFYILLRQMLGTGGYNFIRINRWSVDAGPILGDPLTDIDLILVDTAVRLIVE